MSHPLYNPRGAPFSNQRPVVSNQYGVNTQPVLDMAGARLGPAAGMMSPMMPPQMGYQMTQHPTGLPQDMESTIDMHIRGAREEVRLLNQMMHQQKMVDPRLRKEPRLMDPRLRKEPREEMLSQGNSFPPQRVPGRPEEQSTLHWSNYQNPNKLFAPQVMAQPSPPAQMFQSSGFGTPSGGGRGSAESQPPPASIPAERQQSHYTSESASSILASFGLSNEDLELLSHYPDEQLTPDDLPFILRDIRVRKAKRNLSDVDHRLPSPGTQNRLGVEPQPSKVIDYGHSSKFSYSEDSQDSFKHEKRTTDPQKYVRDAPVAVSTFPSVDTKRPSSGPVAKKPQIDQRKNPPSMEDKTGKSAPTRDSLPAPNRPTAGPPPLTHGTRPNLVNLTESSSALKPGFAVTKPAWSPSFPPSKAGTSKRLPTPTMMNDYSAASPRIFPHTCSLCNIECVQIKDWIEHQNTSIHIESCRHLRKQFPDWNVQTAAVSRTERKPPLDHRTPKRQTRSASRSWSRSPSSWRYHGRSGSRGRRPRSRSPRSRSPRSRSPRSRSPRSRSPRSRSPCSRSPRRYRRARSWSRSPRRAARPQAPLPPRRRSRTPPPRRSRTPPPRRSRTPPPRRSRTPPPWRSRTPLPWRSRTPPPRRSRTPPPRRSRTPPPRRSRSSSFTRLSPPRTTRRLNPRHASPRRQQQRSSSSERLAKKRIESSGLAVTHNTTMESMVESLAPALMAELAKKKSGPSSASTKNVGKKQTSPPTSGKIVHTKTGTFKNVKGKKGPVGTSCFLRLKGLPHNTSHQELLHALQPYGKVKSACVFKKTGFTEATVCMEREEDAKAMADCKYLTIFGRSISICVDKDARDHKVKTLVGKKKEVPSAKLPASMKAKVPAKKTDGTAVKKVVKKDVPKKCVVQILGLPESGYTEDDLKNLATPFGFSSGLLIGVEQKQDVPKKCVVQILGLPESGYTEDDLKNLATPFGFSSGLLIAVEQKQAFVELPNLDSAEAMLKTYKESPPKIQDSQLTFELMTQPIDFNPESLFRMLMGIEKSMEAANIGNCLLVVNNVPMGISPTREVKQLIKRFGSFKQALVLNRKIIFQMDTPAIAKAVFSHFQKFSCIVQNNPLTFSVINKPLKNAVEVKKKPEVKSGRPAHKPGNAAKKGLAAPKTMAAGLKGKAKMSKAPATMPTPTATNAEKPAAASAAATAKTTQPAPPAVSTITTTAKEPPAKPNSLPPEGAPSSAGMAEIALVETKEDQGASQEALPSDTAPAPAPAEGDVTNSAAVEDKDVTATEGDSKEDCKPAAAAKPGSGVQAGRTSPVRGPAPTAPGPNQKPPDFPPVTPEILRALEAALHECRMRSSLRRSEEAKRAEAGKGGAPPPRHESSPQRDGHRGRAQSNDELPPVTHRGSSSGSSSGSRKSRRNGSPDPKRGKGHEGKVDKHKNCGSSRTSKSSSDSKAAGDRKAEEKDLTEDIFLLNLDEFVTVDEVGDDVEGSSQEEEKKTSEPLQHATSIPESPRTHRRTRASPTAKNQKKPVTPTQKSLKEQATPAKGKQAEKVPSKPVGTKDEQGPQAAAEGAGVVVMEMDSETPKTEVELDEKMEEKKVEEEKAELPVASDPQRGEDMEASTPESAAEVVETKTVEVAADATTTTENVSLATESQPEHRAEEGGAAVQEKGVSQSMGETAAPSVPAAQKSQDPPVELQSPTEQSPAEVVPTEAAPTETAPLETDYRVPTKQEQTKKPEPGLKKAPQGLAAALVTLDEVSEEEEDYPDEEEGEELLMQQNEALVTVDEVGGDEDPFLQAVKDLQALVTLDEIVEEDEPSSEPFPFGLGEETGDAFNPKALLTLDETHGDNEETGEEGVKKATSEMSTGSPATHEALLTLDETQGDDEEMEEDKIPSSQKSTGSPSLKGLAPSDSPVIPSAELGELVGSPGPEEGGRGLEELRKMNFVTVDEVGEEEEQDEEEEEGVEPTPSPTVRSGRPKKREGPHLAVRKSTSGEKPLSEKNEEADPTPVESCSVVDPTDAGSQDPALVKEPQTMKTNAPEDVPDSKPFHAIQDPKPNGDKALSEDPQESLCMTDPRATIKEESKLRRDEDRKEEPDTKRHRTESPIPTDYKMPPFSANNPIGLEFVVPKTGFFCKLCSLFYGKEDAAKKTHCSSLKHYQNMEKHFQKLRAGSSQSCLSK